MPWDLRPVDAGFLETAPYRFTATEIVSRPATDLFRAIAGDPAGWGRWFPGFSTSGRYLTPPPYGAGSRRQVRMAGLAYDETILAWEEPAGKRAGRYTFRVDRAGAPLASALVEDYLMADHGTYSTLQWTFAVDPRPLLQPFRPLLDPTLAALFRRAATRLDSHLRAQS